MTNRPIRTVLSGVRPSLKPLAAGALAAIAAILMGGAASSPGSDGRVVALRHVRLFDGDAVTPDATVLFSRGVVVSAGRSVKIPEGAIVLDGAGKTLIPGLIDAHVHMADSYRSVGGLPLEQAAAYGVTTVLDWASTTPSTSRNSAGR